MQNDFNIRALLPEDWKLLRDMRLFALQLNPDVYYSNYEDTKKISEQEWRKRLKQEGHGVFGLFKKQDLIGITGIYRLPDKFNVARLVMSFIHPDYRGQKLSNLLYDARLNWAKEQNGLEIIEVSHRKGNQASQKSIENHGFQLQKKQIIVWPDGLEDEEFIYQLPVNSL